MPGHELTLRPRLPQHEAAEKRSPVAGDIGLQARFTAISGSAMSRYADLLPPQNPAVANFLVRAVTATINLMIERNPAGPPDISVRRVNGEVEILPDGTTVNIDQDWLLTVTEPGRRPRQLNEYEWLEVATPDGTVVGNDSPNRDPSRN
ncbi:hypothetical protein [Mycobacterium camsae]|uniref:hypothetical protein n=1 Tax=Mycobacterium gordonae TaxID=1778 RepID=UPI00197DFA58|nr:hypothetical protein [Mycobacterium gordonae]